MERRVRPRRNAASDRGEAQQGIVDVLNMPDVRERLESMGSNPVGGTPEQFGAYVKQEIARWGKVIRDNNIRIE